MRNKIIFALSAIGLGAALYSAHLYGVQKQPLPPVFNPAPDPYAQGVYANGIIESVQSSGENINVFPEVAGTVTRVLVAEGQAVHEGTPLVEIDDSIQQATVAQLTAQAEAARTTLAELRAQPRRETLDVARAQVVAAEAGLKQSRQTYEKQERSWQIDPASISKDTLDTARNTVSVSAANLEVARRQYELTRAGAWIYDIESQEHTWQALSKQAAAATALLAKYTLRSPGDATVLAIHTTPGSFVSISGIYATYSQGYEPVVVLGKGEQQLQVRCFVDEILIQKLPPGSQMVARMFIRGTNTSVPLQFSRVQPYVVPKIELSNEVTERVDVRVLPVIFRFERLSDLSVYPGELVDVYIRARERPTPGLSREDPRP